MEWNLFEDKYEGKETNSLESKIDLFKKIIWKTSVIEYFLKNPRILNFCLKFFEGRKTSDRRR